MRSQHRVRTTHIPLQTPEHRTADLAGQQAPPRHHRWTGARCGKHWIAQHRSPLGVLLSATNSTTPIPHDFRCQTIGKRLWLGRQNDRRMHRPKSPLYQLGRINHTRHESKQVRIPYSLGCKKNLRLLKHREERTVYRVIDPIVTSAGGESRVKDDFLRRCLRRLNTRRKTSSPSVRNRAVR